MTDFDQLRERERVTERAMNARAYTLALDVVCSRPSHASDVALFESARQEWLDARNALIDALNASEVGL